MNGSSCCPTYLVTNLQGQARTAVLRALDGGVPRRSTSNVGASANLEPWCRWDGSFPGSPRRSVVVSVSSSSPPSPPAARQHQPNGGGFQGQRFVIINRAPGGPSVRRQYTTAGRRSHARRLLQADDWIDIGS